jgi:hypothetical protein
LAQQYLPLWALLVLAFIRIKRMENVVVDAAGAAAAVLLAAEGKIYKSLRKI